MISLQTSIYIGAVVGALGGATLSRIGDQLADDLGRAASHAFSDQEVSAVSTAFYQSCFKREFWFVTSIGAGSGSVLAACACSLSTWALDFFSK